MGMRLYCVHLKSGKRVLKCLLLVQIYVFPLSSILMPSLFFWLWSWSIFSYLILVQYKCTGMFFLNAIRSFQDELVGLAFYLDAQLVEWADTYKRFLLV